MQILIGRGEYKKVGRPTLQTARDWAVLEKKANNGRKAMMHAIHENRAILVPASIDPAAPAQATKTETKPQKAAKPKPAAKASKVAKKPAGDSKAAIAYRMLAACRTHEIDGQILKQMESTSAFSATNFFLAGNLDSFCFTFRLSPTGC